MAYSPTWLRSGALFKWSAEDFTAAIRRAELAERHTTLTAANNLAVRRALESDGVEFTNGDQPSVRVTRAAAAHSGRKRGKAIVTTHPRVMRRWSAPAAWEFVSALPSPGLRGSGGPAGSCRSPRQWLRQAYWLPLER
jgi:hypothetical protein